MDERGLPSTHDMVRKMANLLLSYQQETETISLNWVSYFIK
jgi:hypothetical protein